MSAISRPVIRSDAQPKGSGRARYLADYEMPDALAVRLVLSTQASARITRVGLPDLPDGYFAVDHRDIPGVNAVHVIDDSWPLFPVDRVEYAGQPVLLLVGPNPETLEELARQVEVDYDPDTPAIGLVRMEGWPAGEYAADLAPPHDSPWPPDLADERLGEVFASYRLSRPSADPGAASAREIHLAEEFRTGAQEHIYMEPQAVAAWMEDGTMNITGSMQCPYFIRNALVPLLDMPDERVRVIQSTTGGGFGGKEEYPSVLAGYAAVAALKCGRPVRIVLDRHTDIVISTKRHPALVRFRTQTDGGRQVVYTDVDIHTDGGAFEGLSSTVLQRAIFSATGVYRIPSFQVKGTAHRTNVVPSGAFRGFGSPQAFFAIEMHMTHLARRSGEDPLDFKRRHLLARGDATITGGTLRDPVIVEQMIDYLVGVSGYREKARRLHDQSGPVRRGIGLSLFSHGCGFTGSGERDLIKARVRLRREPDGRVVILVANVEMGQGAETTLRKIVAETVGLPLEDVEFAQPDTARVPDSGPTVASRTVMVVGGLLHKAALRLKEAVGTGSSELSPERPLVVEERYVQPDEIQWDQDTFTGDAYPAFSWGVNIVELELDTRTYEVRPIQIWTAYDIGTAIDRQIVEGQVHGGVIQGLGYATSEVMTFRKGLPDQSTMTDYVIPGAMDVPPIHVKLFDNPYRYGPFGAKGAGEIPMTGVAPAVADAVERALGKPVFQVPLSPEYLQEVDR